MERGQVKAWDDERGYGFIGRPGKLDVFLHATMVEGNRRPERGDDVVFDIVRDERGRLRAANVQYAYREDGNEEVC